MADRKDSALIRGEAAGERRGEKASLLARDLGGCVSVCWEEGRCRGRA